MQDGPWEIAAGTTNWAFSVSPAAGYNTLTLESINWVGTRSASVALTFFYEAKFPLDLRILGGGSVKGLANRALLRAGAYYTATAVPAPNYVFESWTGSVASSNSDLSFQVPVTATNFSLTANFVRSPMWQLAGDYQGLFQTPYEPRLDAVGFLSLALRTDGGFSGAILYHGSTYYYSGKFDSSGSASISGVLDGLSTAITLQLQETNTAGLITGTVSGGSTSPDVQLERLASSLGGSNGPPAGQYTFALPATSSSVIGPQVAGGSGFGTLSLAQSGGLNLNGVLGDSVPFSARCSLTQLGHWPLYVTLDKGKGALLGWVGFSANDPGASRAVCSGFGRWMRGLAHTPAASPTWSRSSRPPMPGPPPAFGS